MSAFDDLEQTVSDLSDNFDDYTSQNDDNLSDLQDSLNDASNSIDQLNTTAGTLTFPLDPNTSDLILNMFIYGKVVLGSGATTVNDPRISPNSTVMVSNVGNSGTVGIPSAAVSNGQVNFGSSSGADRSTLAYFIIP